MYLRDIPYILRSTRHHELSWARLRWHQYGVCFHHLRRRRWVELEFYGEWNTWECPECRREAGRWTVTGTKR